MNNQEGIRRRIFIPIIVLGFTFTSCGIYSFSGSTLPSHIKTVAVPLFDDTTAEFGIDQQLTDAVIDAVTRDNTLKIAAQRSADAVLKGTVISVTDRAGQYNADETASDFRITLTIKVVFEDVSKRKVLWEENFSQWGSYESDREEGIQEAIEKLTTDILNRTVSGW